MLVVLLAFFGPSLFGQAALRLMTGDLHVTAASVNGPLWSPQLHGLKVRGPGLNIVAGTAGVHVASFDPFRRTARLDLNLENATADLKLKTLLSQAGGAGGGGFSLLPGKIDIRNSHLNIDGSGFDVPSGTWTVQSSKAGGQDALKITGATTDGTLNALAKYRVQNGQLVGSVDLNADATILNQYWHDKQVGGVRGGQIAGTYTFGNGPISGDLRLSGASLAVPGASFVRVDGIGGELTHRGDLLNLKLAGRGWNGPVTATGSVDLKGHTWDIRANASPLMSAVAKSLGQTGKGDLKIGVHAYGWNTVTVKADIVGSKGEFSVLPYNALNAHYDFLRDTVGERANTLTFRAKTALQGQQTLSGTWFFNKAGTLAWAGDLLNQPLDLHGTIDAQNTIAGSGRALGGPLSASLALRTRAVSLSLSPDFNSLKGDLSARGTLSNLDIRLANGSAGPVKLAGTARFDDSGFRADLGAVQLQLNRQFRGTWTAQNFDAAGVPLSGSGRLDVPKGDLTGTLAANVPLLSTQPSGPIALNWLRRSANWTFAGGRLDWKDQSFRLRSTGLAALGYRLTGDLAITTALKASGQLNATSGSTTIAARGLGDHVAITAAAGGVTVTADTSLKAGFPTSARIQGSDISGTLTVENGVRFQLKTPGQSASGVLKGQNWNASGSVNLAALRPLIGGNLGGIAQLNLKGLGGTVQVAGQGFGAALDGTFTRLGSRFTTRSTVRYDAGNGTSAAATLSGRVFPDLLLNGPLSVQNTISGPQTLQAHLEGPYSNIRAAVNGQLSALSVAGLSLPAQALNLQATVTPRLALSGTYGSLNLGYSGNAVTVRGTQALSGYGQSGSVTLNGRWAAGWQGELNASGNLGPYAVQVNGPWQRLSTALQGPNALRASGTVNAQTQQYDLQVRGAISGLYAQGRISGQGAKPVGALSVSDGAGGTAQVQLSGLTDFSVQANRLTLAGQTLNGQLRATNGLLSGNLSAGPLQLTATNGLLNASGSLLGHTLTASARLMLPSTLSNVNVKVDGPYITAMANGSGNDLRGSVLIKGQQYDFQGQRAAQLPAQILPLHASLIPPVVNLGGLRYAGSWSGQTTLSYLLGSAPGSLRLSGSGAILRALPSGPLTGSLQVLPSLGGTLRASLTAARPFLPAQLRPDLTLGQLQATIFPTRATLTLANTHYLQQPLGLSAQVSWNNGLRASGVLTHPGTQVRFAYDGQNLDVNGPLDALALRPFTAGLGPLSGSIQTALHLPKLSLEQASGSARFDLRTAAQQAAGSLRLNAGQLSGQLATSIGGQAYAIQGTVSGLLGQGAKPVGALSVSDGAGGTAQVQLSGLTDFSVQASRLTFAGQTLSGQLRATNGLLSGNLSAGPLQLTATNGLLNASGSLLGHTLTASARLTLPTTLTNLRLNVNGPYLSASSSGSGSDVRGSVVIKDQSYAFQGQRAVQLPAQILPLHASLIPPVVNLGGLRYAGSWSGQTTLSYLLGSTPGSLRLSGSGAILRALPSGPLTGSLQVLPSLSGTLRASLTAARPFLPAQLRPELTLGQLQATIFPTRASLTLLNTRYVAQPLGLTAQVSWKNGLSASGILTHPGTQVRFAYDGQNLDVNGPLDALALRPFTAGLGPLSGSIQTALHLPKLSLEQASGSARFDLRTAAQQAAGSLRLNAGQLSGDLRSNLGGQVLAASGNFYPQADADLSWQELRAHLSGDVRTQAALSVSGSYGGRDVNVQASGGLDPARVSVQGDVSGLSLDLLAQGTAGKTSNLAAWQVSGTFAAADLEALAGVSGHVGGTLRGTLNDVRLNAAGQIAGTDFTLPARYFGGVLSVQKATAAYQGGNGSSLATAQISGDVFPTLRLSGPAELNDYLTGRYTLAVTGELSKPRVLLSGKTTGGPRGLDAPGSTVQAALLGSDWKFTATGERLAGGAHGRLGQNTLGGVQQFRFTLNAPYRAGSTTVSLQGVTGWHSGNGFLGDLRVGGNVSGQALVARLTGHGDLTAAASVGSGTLKAASLTAVLPASVLFRPVGTLHLNDFDIAALWGRPHLLSLSGDGRLAGADWSHLSATLSGGLNDVSGELSGPLSASYSAGDVNLTLDGRKLKATAVLNGDDYRASLSSSSVGLARLLPPSAGVNALTLSGSAALEGSLSGGLRQISGTGLNVRGQQTQVGAFTLLGSAQYTPQVVSANLNGTLLGGSFDLSGSLPSGVTLNLHTLRPTAFGLDTLGGSVQLSGDLKNPQLRGRVSVSRPEVSAAVNLSGSVLDPRLNAAADLKNGYTGRLLADVRHLSLSPLQADLHVYGSAAQGNSTALKLDVAGQWPNLSGTVKASLASLPTALTLKGDGTGSYALNAGTLGSGTVTLTLPPSGGLLPDINAAAHLTPLPLLPGATGDASVDVAISGPISRLSVSAVGHIPSAEVSGVTLSNLALNAAGALTGPYAGLNTLTGTITQNGQQVGTLKNSNLTFSSLTAQGYGFEANASGRATLSGTGSATVHLSGAGTTADLKAAYAGGSVALSGTAAASGFQANLNSTGSVKNGWTGTLDLTGGPAGVVTAPGHFRLSGALAQPLLAGEVGVGGAGVRVVANRRAVQLRLVDGPTAQASGVLNLDLIKALWEGQASYTRPEASVTVKLSGAAGDPQALLTATRGGWTASGSASKAGADLSVSDGTAAGRVRWDGETVNLNLPGLNLGGLNLSGVSGTLNAQGSVSTKTLNGSARVSLVGAQTGFTIPVLNLPLSGDVEADLTLNAGRLKADAQLKAAYGTATATISQPQQGAAYTGTLKAQVQSNGGTLSSDLTLNAAGLSGTLNARALTLNVGGLMAQLSGSAKLDGQSFTVQASADSATPGENTQVSITGSGGLADLVPQIASYTAVKPTDQGYSLRASLSGLDLEGLKVAPNLSGRISGEAAISDGGGTFVLRSAALKVGDTVLSARVNGTLAGGDWRLRGLVGTTQAATSQLSGSLSGGVVSGTFQMSGLPVDAFLSAFSGTLPGKGLLTGLARFQFPLSDPASGSLNVVAERLTISSSMAAPAPESATAATPAAPSTATTAAVQTPTPQTTVTQTLAGSGFIDYANRELRNIDLHLSGAGRWDVTGAYTHARVNVTASFQNTTFTPVLSLIPSIRDLTPSLQGTLSLNVAGSYDRPVGNVSATDLNGAISGISIQLPTFSGQLQDSGIFAAQGRLRSGGTVGADGTLDVNGTLETLKLRALSVKYAGLLVPQGLGRIENVQATVFQSNSGTPQEGYDLTAQATGGLGVGSLNVQGSISPTIDLRLSARNFNLPISLIYGRESRINADLTAVEQGTAPDAPINVSGQVNLSSLVLGRVDSSAVLPAPSSAGSTPDTSGGSVAYTSPLPEPLTEFPPSEAAQTVKKVSPFLTRVKLLNIPIHAPSGIRVDESIARAELSGDLVLAGTGSAPTLNGNVTAIRGSVDLRDNTFNISSGSATFDGLSLYPVLNVAAAGDVPLPSGGLVTVNLALGGRFVRQPDGTQALSLDTRLTCSSGCVSGSVDLSSSNPNAEAQLYSLVAVGTPDLTTLPSNLGTLGTSALNTALNVFVLGELQRNIARALGVDVFRINAALPGENGSGSFGATVTVGSYLTRQLYLQYQVDLTGQGVLDATYTTPDNRLTFKASTPIQGFDLSSLRPSFSAAYNFSNRSSLQLGVKSGSSTQFSFGYVYRW
ncbi:hypothetical protein GCM10008957_09770 [Deinococcus ruber]|uniref:Translocation and assembly module TamB C-terminal domain-containing protein n=1 Tax=Deinococcus ruber TaxID=1848197 RepID=A0A918BZD7_9DEIO|nr:hypothetical protein GCM10008957_09770 [Deinococcus ruber]